MMMDDDDDGGGGSCDTRKYRFAEASFQGSEVDC